MWTWHYPHRWMHCPDFLRQPSHCWPTMPSAAVAEADPAKFRKSTFTGIGSEGWAVGHPGALSFSHMEGFTPGCRHIPSWGSCLRYMPDSGVAVYIAGEKLLLTRTQSSTSGRQCRGTGLASVTARSGQAKCTQATILLHWDGLLWHILPRYGCLPAVGVAIYRHVGHEIPCNNSTNCIEGEWELREAFKDMAPDLRDQLARKISYRFTRCPAHGTI